MYRSCVVCVAILLLSSASVAPCCGQDERPAADGPPVKNGKPLTDDLAAIRADAQAFVEAFNQHDAKAVAAHWTQDGDYVADSGEEFAGRDAIEAAYADFFAGNPKARLRIIIDSLRLLSNGAAIEDGRTVVDPVPAGAPSIGKYTAVHVKVDGTWLMASVRDARIETPSSYGNVADLQWLIGQWTAEEHGVQSVSVCRWVGDKSFVERTYTVKYPDGASKSGVQIIGWNPMEGHVQSWDFSSDGGHAIGVWTPRPDGWMAEMSGVTGEGVLTSAVNLLTRLDDNAYVWQSIQRTAGDQPLADTDEVVIKRGTDLNK